MDNLTHSFVGLASAKAGLERLSPYATTICLVSANIADADFVVLFTGDRWTLLQHHRGITHSIVGTIIIGILVPVFALAIERIITRVRGRTARIRFPGLLLASLVAAMSHPLLDWTNNYGVRPLLPWNGRWFYGDLVFIFDPYIWLVLGGVAFLLTSQSKTKTVAWSILGLAVLAFIGLAAWRSGPDGSALRVAFGCWIAGTSFLIWLHVRGLDSHLGRKTAVSVLGLLVIYWLVLAGIHRAALSNAGLAADRLAVSNGEQLIRFIAMPTAGNPFQWQSVAETNRAMYRFKVGVAGLAADPAGASALVRFEKPKGQHRELVSRAERDRRANIFLGFARFPIARVEPENCVGQALVQFADLRYTEPGTRRGNFAVDIPVDCDMR